MLKDEDLKANDLFVASEQRNDYAVLSESASMLASSGSLLTCEAADIFNTVATRRHAGPTRPLSGQFSGH